MSTASIKISIGTISIEYSGDQSYIDSGLLPALKEIIEFSKAVVPVSKVASNGNGSAADIGNADHLTTNTIAGMIGAKTGPDLILAALAHLQIVKGKDKVQRTDIANEIKGATTYYKQTYTSNLSSSLDSLVKNKKINLLGKDVFALTAQETETLKGQLSA